MSIEEPISRESLLTAGWCRGAFIKIRDYPSIMDVLPEKIKQLCNTDSEVYLVPVLYDCALIDLNFEREPWIQVVIGFICSEDPNARHAKNPRKLHLPIKQGSDEFFIEFNAIGFTQIDRELLLKTAIPAQDVSWIENSREVLINWVADRYKQPVFPDSFNNRIRVKSSQLRKLWKREDFCKYCSGIYIKLHTEDELTENLPYVIDVFVVTPFHGRQLRTLTDDGVFREMVSKLSGILRSISGIQVISITEYPESQFTKKQEREFKKLSLENYSYASDDEAALPSDYYGAQIYRTTTA